MAYAYRATITVDNTKVAGSSNLTDFPVLISGTFDGTGSEPDLRTVANGGRVQNVDTTGGASGLATVPADLAFFSDLALTSALDFEIQSYSATTGVFIAWVRIPTLDFDNDTVIYLAYGDLAVTTSQEDVPGTWPVEYVGVWHLQETSTGTGAVTRYDSSGNGNHLTDNNTIASGTGKIGQGADMELSNSEYLSITDAAQTGLEVQDFTFTGWLKLEQLPSTVGSIFSIIQRWFTTHYGYWWRIDADNKITMVYSQNSTASIYSSSTTDAAAFAGGDVGNFVHVGVKADVSAFAFDFYKNGAAIADTNDPASAATSIFNGAPTFLLGFNEDASSNYFDGVMNEMRVYAGLLTADWITTEFNNQNDPSTFYTMSSETSLLAKRRRIAIY